MRIRWKGHPHHLVWFGWRLYLVPVLSGGHDDPLLDQAHWRGRSDTGVVDGTPTWIAAEDTDWTQDTATNFRVRFAVVETAGSNPGSINVKIQYNKNTTGWNDITTTSSNVQAVDAGSSADDASITISRLTGGSDSFVDGQYDEDGDVETSVDLGANDWTEFEHGLVIVHADVANGDTIDLRLIQTDDTLLGAYNGVPTITVNKPSTIQKTLAASATGVVVISQAKTLGQAVAATAVGAADIIKSVGKSISPTAIGVPVLNFGFFRALSATAVGVPALARTFFVQLDAIVGALLNEDYNAGSGTEDWNSLTGTEDWMLDSSGAIVTLTVLEITGIAINATATGVVTLTNQIGKVIAATAVGVPVISKLVSYFKTLSVTAVATPAVFKTIGKTVSATAVGVPDIIKQVSKFITATAVGVAVLTKNVLAPTTTFKTIAATAVGTPTLIKQIEKTLALTAIGVPEIVKTVKITLAVTAIGVVSLIKQIGKTITSIAVGVANVSKVMVTVVAVDAVATGVATLTKIPGKVLTVAATGVPGLVRVISLTLSRTAIGVAVLTKVSTGGPGPTGISDWLVRKRRRRD